MKKSIIGAMLLVLWFNASAVTVDPAKAVIVVDKNADGVVQFAALELQKYLHWITGKKIAVANRLVAGKYPFIFGTPAGVKLKPEEARWEITKDHTRLYGDSTLTGTSRILKQKILTPRTKSGDLTAVYDFLEKQLGVLFLAPGKDGVSFEPAQVLELKEGKGVWLPKLAYRYIWPDRMFWSVSRFYNEDGSIKDAKRGGSSAPAEFQPATRNDYMQKGYETRLWLKQQRMGQSGEALNYGHAFENWWDRFGKTHPEYLAMVNGKRQPPSRPNWVKLCVSNPAVWKQIVKDWAASKKRSRYINACENDGGGFCECAECRKLDMPPRPGAKWSDDLSDRYVFFANQLLKEARKIDPEARVCQYGYSIYRHPPRREKLTDANYIIYVPSMLDNLEEDYQAWQKAGARHFLLRPNDLHMNTPLPMGFDKQIFEAFKTGMKYGVMGTSYDSLYGFWDISGLADYVIARGHVDPSKDYDHWFNEYCSSYGAAAPEAKAYFEYFRTNIWEKRLLPHRKEISKAGNNGNFRLGLMRLLTTFYKESDFDAVEKILRKGMEKKLSPRQKYRLDTLLLVNEHSRLTFRAIAAKNTAKDMAKLRAAVNLIHFRRKYKNRLNLNWAKIFGIEAAFADCTGIKAAEILGQYDDFRTTPQWWVFCTDPEQVGEKEKWHELSYRELWKKNRQMLRIDAPWEKQRYLKDAKFKKMLESYDGIGYYSQTLPIPAEWKGKEIYLIFGAVDESAWVYVNGKFAGKHIFAAANDWHTPFAIPITDMIDWQKAKQTVVVRVEDKSGLGGIWKPVMLAARDKKMNRSDVPLLKAGIVSDIHVLAHEHDWGLNNFANALKIFQEKKIDLLINAGDLAEGGDPAAYALYWKYIERHFPGKTPEHIACEGNHDCSGKGTFKEKFAKVCRGLRRECVNPEHRIIGGYDFITFATYDRLNYAESELPALEHEIRKAVERDPKKPVFVITHLPPDGTVSETGSAGLRRVFKKYPQVISLSGHTHIPLGNERSIWQGEFSAVGTSTLAYGCLEGKCLNTVNTILPFAREVTEALYMEIFADRLEFHRFNVTDGRELGPVWRIEIPYDAAGARYTPRRALQAQPPEFAPEAQILLRYDYGYAYIIFDRAVKGDTAVYYEVELAHLDENTKQYEKPKTYRYAADFYRFERNRQDRIYLKLPESLRENANCRFRVYGVEAFGRRGKPLEMVCRLWHGYKFKNAAPLYPQE